MRTSLVLRLAATVAIGVLLAPAGATASATPAAGTSGTSGTAGTTEALTELVAQAAHARIAQEPSAAAVKWVDTRVTVLRERAARWAFGTVVLIGPQVEGGNPRDWLFLAEQTDGRWRIGLTGEPAFAEISQRTPLVSATERRIFASHGGDQPSAQASGDYRTGMRLPYAVDQSWLLLGGPHAYDAGTGPWSSVDLAGGDQIVRATRQGTAYTTCTGEIVVYHDHGYATRYYHLWNHIWVDGAAVGMGQFLGYTGTEIRCGGAANARHVHFSLMQNGQFVPIAYHIIGKWVFMNGSYQYGGYALHGSTVANVGQAMRNYGALGWTQGIIDANGGTYVNRRSGPGTGYQPVGTVADGATVSIACSRNGTTHTGRWGATSLWNKLTDNSWVSDAFVYTGLDGPVNGWC